MSDADLEISGIDDLDSSTKEIIDQDYSVAEPASKKRKFIEIIDDQKDDLPFQYRHIRHGPHKIRSEVYEVMTHLKTYHSVFPPFQKGGGNPNSENFKKRGKPEKRFWGGRNRKGGKIFKNRGGNPTF